MAQVKIRWTQRVNGRHAGQEEVVEHTGYIDALIAQRRVEVLEDPTPKPIVAVFDPHLPSEPGVDTRVPENPIEAFSFGEPVALERPKPGRPRKPRAEPGAEGLLETSD